jgi:phage terminase Nu1 subunit (DNA packaging protein)
MALVGVGKVAKALNVTVRRVNQLVNEGMPKAGHGRYDLAQCMLWYIRYLQKALERREGSPEDSVGATLRMERTLLIKAQREREELELAARRRELVSALEVKDKWAAVGATLKQRVMALPGRVAHLLEGEDRTTIKARLEEQAREILTVLHHELIYGNGDGNHGGTRAPDDSGLGAGGSASTAAQPESE